jgi:hypothetical protein
MKPYVADLVLEQEINLGAIEYYRTLINAYGDDKKTKEAVCASGVNKAKIDDKFAASVIGPLKEEYAGDWEKFKTHLMRGLELIEADGKAEGKTEVVLIEAIDDVELAKLNLETAQARVSAFLDPFDNTFGTYSVKLVEKTA